MHAGSEDHVADADRYTLMSRPWTPAPEEKPSPLPPDGIRVMALTDRSRRGRERF
jgi:hypothetical protein